MKLLFIILILGILLLGGTMALTNKPLLERGFSELRTFVFAGEEPEEQATVSEQTTNVYTINQAKDISVNCYNDKGVTFIEDGQGRKLNFTGISNGYCKPVPDGQEIFFKKGIDSPVISKSNIVNNIIVSVNTPDAFNYLSWDVVTKEYSEPIYNQSCSDEFKECNIINYTVKPQAYDYNITYIKGKTGERCVNITGEELNRTCLEYADVFENVQAIVSFTLKDGYTLEEGDIVVIDPIYTIANITLDSLEQNVRCEGGGYFCHLSLNDTSLVAYYPFDVV